MGLAGHWLSYAKYARSRLQAVPGEPALVDVDVLAVALNARERRWRLMKGAKFWRPPPL